MGSMKELRTLLQRDSCRDYLLGHVDENSEKERRAINAILWGRVEQFEKIADTGYFNVFGHETIDNIKNSSHFSAIDTGCGCGGTLTALHLPSEKIIQEEEREDSWQFKRK